MSVLNTWKSQENSGSIFDIKQRIWKEEEHICLHKKIVRLYPNYNTIVTSAELWLRLAETVNSMTLHYRIQKLRLYISGESCKSRTWRNVSESSDIQPIYNRNQEKNIQTVRTIACFVYTQAI